MKKGQRLLVLLGGGLLALTLAGCGKADAGPENGSPQEGQPEETQPAEQEPESGQQTETQPEGQEPDSAEQPEGALPAEEDMPGYESAAVRIWGPVLGVAEDSVTVDNRSEVSMRGEMIITVDPERTKILDAVNGYPVELSQLQDGKAVFAYIESAAALSEPPVVNARLILCEVPDDLRVPEYISVVEMSEQSDGSYLLSADNGMQYLVRQDCEILPYLTRNIVTLQDVQKGSNCLVWSDERRTAQKIVLFAE